MKIVKGNSLQKYNQDAEGRWNSIKDTLDYFGKYTLKDNFVTFEFWTDTAGQDIVVEFDYDGTPEDFVRNFVEYADNYDVDDEVALFINMLGQNGVPSSARELVEDCEEAKDTLMEIADQLKHFV